jgi:3D-(3,5/4)-trihydroxycyclohexane-1,2-dione acylhydrolase (decyclizing)
VAETQAGRGSLRSDHPLSLGAVGVTGTLAANRLARDADLVIGVGTRWGDFTTASKSAFQDEGVRFVNLNVSEFDAAKHSGLAVTCDARAGLEALLEALAGHRGPADWTARAREEAAAWAGEVERLVHAGHGPPPSQAEVIGAINDAAGETGVVVCAAGSAPGDLHKLWRARDPKGYHVEYGYSCMGYEIPGGIGVRLAAPEREVFVLVGDGSYLMLPGELVTAVAENVKIVVVIVDNHGYASIGALSRSVGSAGFGTHYRRKEERQLLDAPNGDRPAQPAATLPVDLAANAESLGARVLRARTIEDLRAALEEAKAAAGGPVVVHIQTDRYEGVPSYEGWWEVPVAEVSDDPAVQRARSEYEQARAAQRRYIDTP